MHVDLLLNWLNHKIRSLSFKMTNWNMFWLVQNQEMFWKSPVFGEETVWKKLRKSSNRKKLRDRSKRPNFVNSPLWKKLRNRSNRPILCGTPQWFSKVIEFWEYKMKSQNREKKRKIMAFWFGIPRNRQKVKSDSSSTLRTFSQKNATIFSWLRRYVITWVLFLAIVEKFKIDSSSMSEKKSTVF